MISLVLLGTGNLAKHLFNVFLGVNEIRVLQVIGRNVDQLAHFKDRVVTETDFTKIADADIYIIAVSDDAIASVATFLKDKNGLVVHTSGSVPLKSLGGLNKRGVFYPLQTFSEGKTINFKEVPVCIEAEDKNDLELLKKLAGLISLKVHEITSDQRKSLHLAAVFVNNFTNFLFTIGQDICTEHNLPFSLLTPLIKETVNKLDYLPPFDAQTGPAKRNDVKTMESHLKQLKNKNYQDIYSLFSQLIGEKYGQKL
ncbi:MULTISPECIES: Rossmann-like and DUF2520 domain-containing protein [unclassified Arenibacter]|jgi:predicted short-subunit dehydrogenase-like oxidoreductase (DUF2520 family)|uniref:Rossmann-like and DUF2520 domain-containing protein n=1 Tax=unclassified Arenibacter TaxID=2615047 RepID=UPI000E3429E5|nr:MULTISPECIES: Rossmann-like and DUF2520 domain-containing protein [unclassified Arenibacter]MCM4162844.1 DUF2520 domain-containing protein [Arenibacter sp. A80]RFT56897.1 DUF2520 domain-containing protein [Arenibacter sp. P308M17]